MGKRRKARELALKILFHLEYNHGNPEDALSLIYKNFKSPESERAFSKKLVLGVYERLESIDKLITQSSKNWRMERMSHVDRSILRLGTFEMLYLDDVPPKVTIDEAVELGKKFGTEDSGAFINGILDNIFNRLKQEDPLLKNKI
ncbi:MAG: transcription antitermination factor NusB [Deltaproteobacteria bacterium]|nr:transcription antitermination factor NusB [Deltaproteobacteria bacterium]